MSILSNARRFVGSAGAVRVRTASVILSVTLTLAACSSVPDAVNPAEWWKSASGSSSSSNNTAYEPAAGDQQTAQAPTPSGPASLPADSENARYTDEVIAGDTVATQPLPASGEQAQVEPMLMEETTPPPPLEQQQPAVNPVFPFEEPAPPPAPMAEEPPPAPLLNAAPSSAPAGDEYEFETVVISGEGVSGGSGVVAPVTMTSAPAPMVPVNTNSGGSLRSQLQRPDAPSHGLPLDQFDPMRHGVTYHVGTIDFASGSAALDAQGRRMLIEVGNMVKQYGGTVRVVGHASSRTRDMDINQHNATNQKISDARAQNAASMLTTLGISGNNIYAGGVSDSQPKYFEIMPTGDAGNRRAEIYIEY